MVTEANPFTPDEIAVLKRLAGEGVRALQQRRVAVQAPKVGEVRSKTYHTDYSVVPFRDGRHLTPRKAETPREAFEVALAVIGRGGGQIVLATQEVAQEIQALQGAGAVIVERVEEQQDAFGAVRKYIGQHLHLKTPFDLFFQSREDEPLRTTITRSDDRNDLLGKPVRQRRPPPPLPLGVSIVSKYGEPRRPTVYPVVDTREYALEIGEASSPDEAIALVEEFGAAIKGVELKHVTLKDDDETVIAAYAPVPPILVRDKDEGEFRELRLA